MLEHRLYEILESYLVTANVTSGRVANSTVLMKMSVKVLFKSGASQLTKLQSGQVFHHSLPLFRAL